MGAIKDITVEIIEDSRRVPTLSVTVLTDNEKSGNFMVPSGASTGLHEARELRDDGESHGGVSKAREQILNVVLPALRGKKVDDQKTIDDLMIALDGTPDKSSLGGNSIIGVSLACAKAGAKTRGLDFFEYLRAIAPASSINPPSVPRLYFNLINGGRHANTGLAFQEYHIVPMTKSVSESLEMAGEVQKKLGEIIKKKYGEVAKGDEGGFALDVANVRIPLDLLSLAIRKCGFEDKAKLALDVASSSFYNKEKKTYIINNREYNSEQLLNLYKKLANEYPLISIEDPFHEEDFSAFTLAQVVLGLVIIVGDDLTVTNKFRLQKAIDNKSIRGVIIKPNQIGTVSETIEAISTAHRNKINCIMSHRSGETMDDVIADFTQAFHTFGMKSGARGSKEREVKYKRLKNIEKL